MFYVAIFVIALVAYLVIEIACTDPEGFKASIDECKYEIESIKNAVANFGKPKGAHFE